MQKLKNISFKNVTFDNEFWKTRYDLNRFISLQSVYDRFEQSGRFDALRFNYEKGVKPYPHIFFDSDVAKWIEAVGYLIEKNGGHEKEQTIIDALVCEMAAHQTKNGYLNSHFIQIEPENVFQKRGEHELYCAGHLIEAAIAYDKATGKHTFLNVMKKYVDCIEQAFIVQKTAAFHTCGHEEIELALLKLYDYTSDIKYLNLAMFFINERGIHYEPWHNEFNETYDQSNAPVRDLEKAEGHAVRAVYLYTAMSEAYIKTGDERLHKACLKLFNDIINGKMYITGGIGSASKGETFTVEYDLPNLEAYSESCAALGLQLFSLSLQQTALDHRFADVIERVMYNNMLSSTSLDGKAFFYENELEIHLSDVNKETSLCEHARTHLPLRHRLEVFECSCCPPNINRLFARVGDFFFSEYCDSLVVNQYADLTLQNDKINMKMTTVYPVDGIVKFTISECKYDKIILRKPEWCDNFIVKNAEFTEKEGYIEISGSEKTFTIDFKMQPYFIEANPRVRADNGRVALCFGPTVYCLERLDNPYELNSLSIDINAKIDLTHTNEYPMPNLEIRGFADENFNSLYRKACSNTSSVSLKFRPYWTFANRQECDMLVWVRKK